jgi:hypothetical protein
VVPLFRLPRPTAVRQGIDHRDAGTDRGNPDQGVRRRARLADDIATVLGKEQFLDAAPDAFMVIHQKWGDSYLLVHEGASRAYSSRVRGPRDNVPLFRRPARL